MSRKWSILIKYILERIDSNISLKISKLDKPIFYCIVCIFIVSIIAIMTIAPVMNHRINTSVYSTILKHLIFLSIAFIIMIYIANINIHSMIFYNNLYFLIITGMLVLVLLFGKDIKGASRWLDVFGFSIQPSELLKPFFIILNAKLLSEKTIKNIIKVFIVTGITISLFILEPDFGMTLLYCLVCGFQLFLSNVRLKLLLLMAGSVIMIFIIAFFTVSNVRNRISGMFVHDNDSSYQTSQASKAMIAGGFFGQGLGNGVVKYNIPDSYTDFIFSALFEEIGAFFAILLICLYFFIAVRAFFLVHIYINNKILLSIGSACSFVFITQTFINIAVNLSILPNKGMTLPFISYGGSSMIAMSVIVGLILNLTTKKNRVSKMDMIYNDL